MSDVGCTLVEAERRCDPDSPRAEEYLRVFCGLDVPIKGYEPFLAEMPEVGVQLVYLVDLERLKPETRQRLIAHISQRFKLPVEDVARDIDAENVPVLADGVTVFFEDRSWI